MKKLKKLRKLVVVASMIVGLTALLFFAINFYIVSSTAERVFETPQNLEKSQAALILGASVKKNGDLSDVLKDRTLKAVELYQMGKVSKLLVSGDHGQDDYDEVNAVKNFLLANDIPGEDIFLDHAGFDTYDSLYRAKYIFEVDSLIVVTQKFHLPRAVYIGQALNMNVQGYVADRQTYVDAQWYAVRESLARIKAFADITLHANPQHLGEIISITGNGMNSWD